MQFYVGKKKAQKKSQNEHYIELDGGYLVSPPCKTTKLKDGLCMNIKL